MTRKVVEMPPTEEKQQIQFAVFLTKMMAKYDFKFHASPNGGSRNLIEAIKLKRMGLSKGFPDIFVAKPYGAYTGLFIEMKRAKGSKVSDEQKEWIEYLNNNGYYASVAFGFSEAVTIFNRYFHDEIS